MATDSIYDSTAHGLSILSLPLPHPLIRFSHFSFSHTDTSPKHGRRRTCPHIKAPPHLRLNTNSTLNNRAPSPPRPPRRATPARAFLLPRHSLALLTSSSAPGRASATQASSMLLRSAVPFSTRARQVILAWHIWEMTISHFCIVYRTVRRRSISQRYVRKLIDHPSGVLRRVFGAAP
jgi:hypothetical protein